MSNAFKVVVISLAASVVGCESKPSRLTTPDRLVKCPVCEQEAKLWRFNNYEADYNCPNHFLTYRRDGYFESASPRKSDRESD